MTRALLLLLLAGCAPSKPMPLPACRNSLDCAREKVLGAECVSGRCAFTAEVAGNVIFNGTAPHGTLHVVAYPAEAFLNTIGPLPKVTPLVAPITFSSPKFPAAYRLTGLPRRPIALYAFISVDDKNTSATRACLGDLMGVSQVPAHSGSADVQIHVPVNSNRFCP